MMGQKNSSPKDRALLCDVPPSGEHCGKMVKCQIMYMCVQTGHAWMFDLMPPPASVSEYDECDEHGRSDESFKPDGNSGNHAGGNAGAGGSTEKESGKTGKNVKTERKSDEAANASASQDAETVENPEVIDEKSSSTKRNGFRMPNIGTDQPRRHFGMMLKSAAAEKEKAGSEEADQKREFDIRSIPAPHEDQGKPRRLCDRAGACKKVILWQSTIIINGLGG